jgi:hypothetical protein
VRPPVRAESGWKQSWSVWARIRVSEPSATCAAGRGKREAGKASAGCAGALALCANLRLARSAALSASARRARLAASQNRGDRQAVAGRHQTTLLLLPSPRALLFFHSRIDFR